MPTWFSAAFTIGDTAYVCSGYGLGTAFWRYDPGRDTWARRVDFAGGARGAAVAFSIGNNGSVELGYGDDGPRDLGKPGLIQERLVRGLGGGGIGGGREHQHRSPKALGPEVGERPRDGKGLLCPDGPIDADGHPDPGVAEREEQAGEAAPAEPGGADALGIGLRECLEIPREELEVSRLGLQAERVPGHPPRIRARRGGRDHDVAVTGQVFEQHGVIEGRIPHARGIDEDRVLSRGGSGVPARPDAFAHQAVDECLVGRTCQRGDRLGVSQFGHRTLRSAFCLRPCVPGERWQVVTVGHRGAARAGFGRLPDGDVNGAPAVARPRPPEEVRGRPEGPGQVLDRGGAEGHGVGPGGEPLPGQERLGAGG